MVAERPASQHLEDVLEAIGHVSTYTRAGKRAFDANPMMRDAVIARLIQIGQAVKDAQGKGLELNRLEPAIRWKEIAGMRDRLAHRIIDRQIVWGVVRDELPKLKRAVEAILRGDAAKPAAVKKAKHATRNR